MIREQRMHKQTAQHEFRNKLYIRVHINSHQHHHATDISIVSYLLANVVYGFRLDVPEPITPHQIYTILSGALFTILTRSFAIRQNVNGTILEPGALIASTHKHAYVVVVNDAVAVLRTHTDTIGWRCERAADTWHITC